MCLLLETTPPLPFSIASQCYVILLPFLGQWWPMAGLENTGELWQALQRFHFHYKLNLFFVILCSQPTHLVHNLLLKINSAARSYHWPLQKIPQHTIMLFVCHPKYCISIVFSFSWGHFNSQEKLKTKLMQHFGVTNKEHYGMLWYFWSGQLIVWLLFLKCHVCLVSASQLYHYDLLRFFL